MADERRESSFDELAKGLASGDVSRGRALRLMGVALVGGTLASVPGIAWAAPRPRPNGKKCKRDSQCASGNCAGGVCQAQGGCPSGTTECSGPAGFGCVPDPCPQGQVLNTVRCQCVTSTGGITLGCICGDTSERFICFAGQTCPDSVERTTQCTAYCGAAGYVNSYCYENDIC